MEIMSHEWLDTCLHNLNDLGGSDLHLKVGSPPRVRVNGILRSLPGQPIIDPSLVQEIAVSILSPAMYEDFQKKFELDFAYSVNGLGRFRVNIFRQRGSISFVMRMVLTEVPTCEELGLPEVVTRLANESRGLVLVTGPTGSGKTTTLASMIAHINQTRECHIVTIEDPVEVLHKDDLASINQREIGLDAYDFASALKAAMRQDPDIILVGEMRDIETVEAALRAAETGHLVLSTLHTVDSTETINRIVDFFPPYQQTQVRVALAGSLKGVICQRLISSSDGQSRVAALEVMVSNGRIQQCIIDPLKTSEIAEIVADGDYYGMQTFDQSLAKLFASGSIDLKSAMAGASNPHDLKLMLQQRGLVGMGSSGRSY